MISLILPYWDRQEAANKALVLLAKHYQGLDLEIVVVDDGNASRFCAPDLPLNVKVVRRPLKSGPSSCISAWNEGVRQSRGEIIVLSCIEVLHERPVLAEMAAELERMGEMGYVLAAAWNPEQKEWHCHSQHSAHGSYPIPKGTGRSFCGMMRRSLYERVGGFDEIYAQGVGYEDVDLIHRLLDAGATFKVRDDLVVTHPKAGATILWPPEMFDRNRTIFESRWVNKPINVVCVKAGSAYGPEYVNILFDMVRRNLPDGYRGKFWCFTDSAEGIDSGVLCRPLPSDLEKWWGKLYLFKRGLFQDGERVMFLDLDTLIVGSLEEIVKYRGPFATLRDFYFPDRVGPAVMLWEAGEYASSIWEEWEAEGKPRHAMGDLWWINKLDQGRFAHRCDKLQELYPGAFVSFKAGCHPYPPKGTKVVCFHGEPRPHNCTAPWVKDVWKVGGGGMPEITTVCNTENEALKENVRHAIARGLPELEIVAPHGGRAVIVGGGPSVSANLDEIRRQQQSGAIVVALNGAARYLKRNGILPDWQVIADARAQSAAFVCPDVPRHFICSQCHPDALGKARDVTLFHVNTEATIAALGSRMAHLISTGSTVGLLAMGILHTQGFRVQHLFGFDSSYTEDHHAYEQKMNDDDRVIEVVVGERTFRCAPWMLAQAQQFQELAPQLANEDATITVAGDGLLPYIARLMTQQEITT